MDKIDGQSLLFGFAASADRMDEFAVVRDLVESAAGQGLAEDRELERARAAVMAGRPEHATELLKDVTRPLDPSGDLTWRDVVALASWAAQGDLESLGTLHRIGQGLQGTFAVSHAYLLAAAAEQAGQHDLADSVWRTLLEISHGTMVQQRRVMVAEILARSTTDGTEATGPVGRGARLLTEMLPRPEDSVAPTLDVVTRLEARGDRAGARLLLEALAQMRPQAAEVVRLRDERATPRSWWRERLPGIVATLVVTAAAAGAGLGLLPGWVPVVGVLVAAAVWRWWRLPGKADLSSTDAGVLAHIRRWLPDAAGERSARSRNVGAAITGGAIGLLVAGTLAGVVTEGLMADLYATHADRIDAVAWPVVIAVTLLCAAGGTRLLRPAMARSTQQLVDQQRVATAEGYRSCSCLRAVGMRGIETETYLAHHLQDADPDVAAFAPTLAEGVVAVHQCPVSRTPWLSVRLPDREALLFRGTLVRVRDDSPQPGAESGGYL